MQVNPIAIVGVSCLFPNANSIHALWDNIVAQRDCLSDAKYLDWDVSPEKILRSQNSDKLLNIKGGYISQAEVSSLIEGYPKELDKLFHWVLLTAEQAAKDAGLDKIQLESMRSGLILGNLSFPTRSFTRLTEDFILSQQKNIFAELAKNSTHPLNRFMSGLPAQYTAAHLNIKGDAFSIDAACASGLYAIKLACDRLHNHSADIMFAGGVNASDDLFIHMGFSALQALSPSGQSRPFHTDANGLVPGQGAGFVVLKRLEDAIANNDYIYGLIRGIGLSNDGKGRGFLLPDMSGQIRAMHQAYHLAGLSPQSIGYIECHATGTPVGDKTELLSMEKIFHQKTELPIGTLKGNIGHTITASAFAALFKVLQAMKHKTLPPAIVEDSLAHYLPKKPFYLLDTPRDWSSDKPLRAAINAFGFGGCNAHAIIESYEPSYQPEYYMSKIVHDPIAITGIAIVTKHFPSKNEFFESVLKGKAEFSSSSAPEFSLDFQEARFPPNDLRNTLGQQLLIMKAVYSALKDCVGDLSNLDKKTAVLVGMQCDADICRFSLRWRLEELLKGTNISQQDIEILKNQIIEPLNASHVIGSMPNIVANRINQQYDFQGIGYSISGEEGSGVYALQQAQMQLQNRDINMAVVGAVDIGSDKLHQQMLAKIFPHAVTEISDDVAVVLVLERLSTATSNKRNIYAVIGEEFSSKYDTFDSNALLPVVGNTYYASGLLQVACASLCCSYGVLPQSQSHSYRPWPKGSGNRVMQVKIQTQTKQELTVQLKSHNCSHLPEYAYHRLPYLYLQDGKDINRLLSTDGFPDSAKLVIVLDKYESLSSKINELRILLDGEIKKLEIPSKGIFLQIEPLGGEVAAVFTAAHTSYSGMGRSVFTTFPNTMDTLEKSFPFQAEIFDYLYRKSPIFELSFLDELVAYSYISQFQYHLLNKILGVQPDAMIGYCSGETNALFASGAWDNLPEMIQDIENSEIYTRYLAGEFETLPEEIHDWTVYRVLAQESEIQQIILDYPSCRITIKNANDDFVVAGPSCDMAELIKRFAKDLTKKMRYNMVIHCDYVKKIAKEWYQVHCRKTNPTKIRQYSCAKPQYYYPTQETAADALLQQAIQRVDFPRVINQAWKDGVRIFIEHGPKNFCTALIRNILQDKEHSVIAFDSIGVESHIQFANVAALLLSHGRIIDYPKILDGQIDENAKVPGAKRNYLLNWPDIQLLIDAVEDKDISIHNSLKVLIDTAAARFIDYRQKALFHFNQQLEASLAFIEGNVVPSKNTCKSVLFSREDLITHASGKISTIFGPKFSVQDSYKLQVRMPEPPFLLADRVISIDAIPCSYGTGTIETETDITNSAWYLIRNRMPAGIMIEAGQADLMLISWLGADLLNQGKRVYRLLGCELEYQNSLPKTGETLNYKIQIDSHAQHEDTRLFFFHYDCTIEDKKYLIVRNCQAGFFTYEELANSKGIIWDPSSAGYRKDAQWDLPKVENPKHSFSEEEVRACFLGDSYRCFGDRYKKIATQNYPPIFANAHMQLIQRVEELDPRGGPWHRGYCRASFDISPEAWVFKGHFKNDPCMPGTLIFEASLQLMAFYLIAIGYTLDCDSWRFEPMPGKKMSLRCGGQVTPLSKKICYELFVEEQISGPVPSIRGDILVQVDGLKVFHGRGIALQLTRDYPINFAQDLIPKTFQEHALCKDKHFFDYRSMLAFAWGKPSEAMGAFYASFDEGIQVARMPGPPYNFMHFLSDVSGPENQMEAGIQATIGYQVPQDAWYFIEQKNPIMPFCVLLEIALQPCGWLASYVGCPLRSKKVLSFRNLDGASTFLSSVRPNAGIIYTTVTLKNISHYDETFILAFEVICSINNQTIVHMQTSFGFFEQETFQNQTGLLPDPDEQKFYRQDSEFFVDLKTRPKHYFEEGTLHLPSKKLCMLDKVTGFWRSSTNPNHQLTLRATKAIDPYSWYFKAHFYLDPVQPGSLGLEMMIQLLKFYVIHEHLAKDISNPEFQVIADKIKFEWKYRGQVTFENQEITTIVSIQDVQIMLNKVVLLANASLWVDNKKIYQANNIQLLVGIQGDLA